MSKVVHIKPIHIPEFEAVGEVPREAFDFISHIKQGIEGLNQASDLARSIRNFRSGIVERYSSSDAEHNTLITSALLVAGVINEDEAQIIVDVISDDNQRFINDSEFSPLTASVKRDTHILMSLSTILERLVDARTPIIPIVCDLMQQEDARMATLVQTEIISTGEKVAHIHGTALYNFLLAVDANILGELVTSEFQSNSALHTSDLEALIERYLPEKRDYKHIPNLLTSLVVHFGTKSTQALDTFMDELDSLVSGVLDPEVESAYIELKEVCREGFYMLRQATLRLSHMTSQFESELHENSKKVEAIRRKHGQVIIDAVSDLATEAVSSIKEELSYERTLGALALETWSDAVLDELVRSGNAQKIHFKTEEFQHGKLHDTITHLQNVENESTKNTAIERLQEQIDSIESRYIISSKRLRSLPEGLEFRHYLEQLRDSSRLVFSGESAHVLATLALFKHELANLPSDYRKLQQLWIELSALKPRCERTEFLACLDGLSELYGSVPDRLRDDKNLHLLWELARFIDSEELQDNSNQKDAFISEDMQQKFDQEFCHVEPIEPFPPETSIRQIREDFDSIARFYKPAAIQWERIENLMILGRKLRDRGYAVAEHRLLNTTWHPLPHYVLEIVSAIGSRITVIESPVFKHATYVVNGDDWRDVVVETRTDAKVLGAHAKYHVQGRSPEDHVLMLFEEIEKYCTEKNKSLVR